MENSKKVSLWLTTAAVIILIVSVVGRTYVSAQSAPAATKSGSTLEQRVAQRKAERKIKLDESNTQRIESTCINAQTKVRQLRDQYINLTNTRSDTYRKIDARLWIAIGSLKYVDKDTFKLEQQRQAYIKQVNAFEASAKEFNQVLDDMASMNCQADANGFKALLETARLYNDQIRKQVDGIRDQVINNLKPTLSDLANQLKPNQSTE